MQRRIGSMIGTCWEWRIYYIEIIISSSSTTYLDTIHSMASSYKQSLLILNNRWKIIFLKSISMPTRETVILDLGNQIVGFCKESRHFQKELNVCINTALIHSAQIATYFLLILQFRDDWRWVLVYRGSLSLCHCPYNKYVRNQQKKLSFGELLR